MVERDEKRAGNVRPVGREERLKAALKANIARRKAQAAKRRAKPDHEPGPGPGPDEQ